MGKNCDKNSRDYGALRFHLFLLRKRAPCVCRRGPGAVFAYVNGGMAEAPEKVAFNSRNRRVGLKGKKTLSGLSVYFEPYLNVVLGHTN